MEWTPRRRPRSSRCSSTRSTRTTRSTTPGASFDVIVVDGQPVGRLYVARWSDEIRIVDIALLSDYCNRGIGTTLLRGLQSEAAAAGKPLRIHVERFNPALRLYERLGFRRSRTGASIVHGVERGRPLPVIQPSTLTTIQRQRRDRP